MYMYDVCIYMYDVHLRELSNDVFIYAHNNCQNTNLNTWCLDSNVP